jgi:hypothetical protein
MLNVIPLSVGENLNVYMHGCAVGLQAKADW